MEVREPAAAATAPPLRREHHEVERQHRLHLAPRLAAPAGLVARLDRLDHHALVPGGERLGEEALGLGRIGGGDPRHRERADRAVEQRQALAQRPIDERLAIEVEHVEEERAQHAEVEPPRSPEPAHRVLERARRLVLVQTQHLSVEHDGIDVERRRDRGDLGQPVGDVVQVAREDPHAGARAVDLDARAVDLPLDRRRARGGERRGRIRRRRREHRQDRPTDLERDGGQAGLALGERDPRGCGEIAAEHRRSAHRGRAHLRRPRDRVAHHARECALAQLADEQAREEVGLGGGRARKERGDPARVALPQSRRRPSRPLRRGIARRRRSRALATARRARRDSRDGRPTDADPPLRQLARQERDRGSDLTRREALQQLRRAARSSPRAWASRPPPPTSRRDRRRALGREYGSTNSISGAGCTSGCTTSRERRPASRSSCPRRRCAPNTRFRPRRCGSRGARPWP